MLQRRDNASTTHTLFAREETHRHFISHNAHILSTVIIFFLSVVVVLASYFTFRYFRQTSRLVHYLDSQQQWDIPTPGPKDVQAEYLVYGPVFTLSENPRSSLSNMSRAEKGEDPSQRVNAHDPGSCHSVIDHSIHM